MLVSPFPSAAVVIAFFVCWAPYHSQRLLFLYVSLHGHWTNTLRDVNQKLFLLAGELFPVFVFVSINE